MIAVDTNILVYAHREDSSWHKAADKIVTELAESKQSWAIPWPCVHEFLAITTHPKIYGPPTPLDDALKQIDCRLESPQLVMLGEQGNYWSKLCDAAQKGNIKGPQIHDARIAAICLQYSVSEFWSADRDFGRFPDLNTRNPLIRRHQNQIEMTWWHVQMSVVLD
jgi:toxin-antitoxin system PIN domain toxin